MRIAFLFPGQGVGIERDGRPWCVRSDIVRHFLETAASQIGLPMGKLFESGTRGIMPTEVLEPIVNFVQSFCQEPVPTLEAGRQITAKEAIFAGHFPEVHLWPGVFTIEGLGQADIPDEGPDHDRRGRERRTVSR